jgi:hypothetical protein
MFEEGAQQNLSNDVGALNSRARPTFSEARHLVVNRVQQLVRDAKGELEVVFRVRHGLFR